MQSAKPKVYFTDGEGPVVFKDLARDISQKRLPNCLFDTISMWVVHNSESPISPFEPGDTLSLLVPHLLLHNVTDDDLLQESFSIRIANGAENHLRSLRQEGWQIRIVSTAYSHLWQMVGPRIGIEKDHIASTTLNLAALRNQYFDGRVAKRIREAEEIIEEQSSKVKASIEDFKDGVTLSEIFQQPHMVEISNTFDELYFSNLPNYDFPPLDVVSAIGGERKVDAIKKFSQELNVSPSDLIYVGDSITDDRAHKFITESKGLSIAVNGDKFALRNSIIAIATEDMQSIKPIIDRWVKDGIDGVTKYVAEGQFVSGSKERNGHFAQRLARCSIVTPECIDSAVAVHREARARIRGNSLPLL